MTLSIKDPEADKLARQLAKQTGASITQAVIEALREKLSREQRRRRNVDELVEEGMAIGRHCASLPLLDSRTADEILGYDEHGLPTL